MKLSNLQFRCINKSQRIDTIEATVTVTTGKWFWKEVTIRPVFAIMVQGNIIGHWRFSGTNEYTPGEQVEKLYQTFVDNSSSQFLVSL